MSLKEQPPEPKNGIQVIARAASIMRSLKDKSEGLSLGEIAKSVNLPRSTVQRIVNALQTERLVISVNPGRGIRLGPELSSLAESARIDLTDILHPYLVAMAKQTGETIDLAVLRNKKMIFIDQIPGTHRLRTVSSVGDTFPMTQTANGKACLAKMTDDKINQILNFERPAYFAEANNVNIFMDEIATIRQQGIAFDRDEHTVGISAVGVAFTDFQGDIYAISTPIPSARFKLIEAELIQNIQTTLATIETLEIITMDT